MKFEINSHIYIAEREGEANVIVDHFTYFYPEKPFLISKEQDLFSKISQSGQYVAERKYNGCRLLLHYINGSFQFWNRHGEKFNFKPEGLLLEKLKALPLQGYCLFDGELRNNKTKGIQQKIMLFDVFIWNSEFLLNKPFSERRKMIESLVPIDGDPLGTPFQFKSNFSEVFEEVIKDSEIEGLVMKRLNGIFKISRKSGIDSAWMYKVRRASKNYRH